MQGVLVTIATRQDLENCLEDAGLHDQALDHLQALMDEEWGYDSGGAWVLVGGGGLARLGLSRAEAVALGAVARAVDEPAPVPVGGMILAASARIDAHAESLCNQVITPGSAQMARYQRKEGQAKGYLAALAAGTLPEDATARAEAYPAVYGEVGITAETPEAVAVTIVAMADAWWAYGDAVEAARLAGKRAVEAARTPAAVAAAEAAIVWPADPE